MTITATCGHQIELYDCVQLKTMDYTIGGAERISRAYRIGVYCHSCASKYTKWGITLETEENIADWLSGKTDYPNLENLQEN